MCFHSQNAILCLLQTLGSNQDAEGSTVNKTSIGAIFIGECWAYNI